MIGMIDMMGMMGMMSMIGDWYVMGVLFLFIY